MIRLWLAISLMLGAAAQAGAQDGGWTLYTDTYRPFIAAPEEPESQLITNVRRVLDHAELDYELEYAGYSYADYAVRSGRTAISFPWRKTEERDEAFNLTQPLATFVTEVYYNRRFWAEAPGKAFKGSTRIGLVANTVYGPEVCDFFRGASGGAFSVTEGGVSSTETKFACPFLSQTDIGSDAQSVGDEQAFVEYQSETAAIKALLLNEIDFLALPKSVKAATMQSVFPNQGGLVQSVSGVQDESSFHIIAPKTSAGARFVSAFDDSYNELIEAGALTPWTFKQALDPEIAPPARLVAAEGFPMIIAFACKVPLNGTEKCPKDQREFYALPQGSPVLVLSWSDSIRQPFSNDEKLYEIMTDETKILTLDDPFIGRELFVKTMHISLSR